MIRETRPDGTNDLIEIGQGTGVFKPAEIVALREVLDEFHTCTKASRHPSSTYVEAGRITGFAYYASAAMTDRTWYLFWIAIERTAQARGIGGELLRYAEDQIRDANRRLILIETSSLPHYEPTRRFYLEHGYEQACALRDFYADGDDMIFFAKRIILVPDAVSP